MIGSSRIERPRELAIARSVTVQIPRSQGAVSLARLHWTASHHDHEKGTKP